MSYRIEYDWVAIRLPKERIESAYEDHFILASLGGDNNVYRQDGKRPRLWSCMALGMSWQVMQTVVEFAAACEGGSLKPHGRWMKPEAYIARLRRVVADWPGLAPDRLFENRDLQPTADLRAVDADRVLRRRPAGHRRHRRAHDYDRARGRGCTRCRRAT